MTDFYVAPTGSDANTGLSLAQAKKSRSAIATLLNAAGVGPHVVYQYGHSRIPSGGDPTSVLCNPSATFSGGLTFQGVTVGGVKASHGYMTRFEASDAGWITISGNTKTIPLVLPTGVTVIDSVMIDWEGRGTRTHLQLDIYGNSTPTSEGECDLVAVGSSAACLSTAHSWYHDPVGNLLWRNTDIVGAVEVVYRQPVSAVMTSAIGKSLYHKNLVVLQPYFVDSAINTFGVVFYMTSAHFTDYGIEDTDFVTTCWHSIAFFCQSPAVVLTGPVVKRCYFRTAVVSDISPATQSMAFIVPYTQTDPATYLLNDFLCEDLTFVCARPMRLDGTVLPAGTAGIVGNNRAQIFYCHGGVTFTVTMSNCMAKRIAVRAWDYEVSDPYLAQRNTQAHTPTLFSNSVWGSRAEDVQVYSMLPYVVGNAGLRYGVCSFVNDVNVCIDRFDLKSPNTGAVAAQSVVGLQIMCAGGSSCHWEFREPLFTCEGSDNASFVRYIQGWRLGGSGAATVLLACRFPTYVQEATTIVRDLVWYDTESSGGTCQFTLYQVGQVYHNNDVASPNLISFAYDWSTAEVPLGQGSTILSNGWYSGFGASRYDLNSATRISEVQWRTHADGPLEGKITDNGGVKACRYDVCGVWNKIGRYWEPGSAILTAKIPDSITLPYLPGVGIGGAFGDRSYGSEQHGVGRPTNRPSAPVMFEQRARGGRR